MLPKVVVYDFIPLKQGLKLQYIIVIIPNRPVYDFIPLKQGLKLSFHKIPLWVMIMFMTLFH